MRGPRPPPNPQPAPGWDLHPGFRGPGDPGFEYFRDLKASWGPPRGYHIDDPWLGLDWDVFWHETWEGVKENWLDIALTVVPGGLILKYVKIFTRGRCFFVIVCFVAGTDATRVSSHNPWFALYWMVTGKTMGGTRIASDDNLLSREEALRLFTVGSAWFSGEEGVKGRIAPGQYADFAILTADYFTIPEEEIRAIESVLTVTGGEVAYANDMFDGVKARPQPPVKPDWSPVANVKPY